MEGLTAARSECVLVRKVQQDVNDGKYMQRCSIFGYDCPGYQASYNGRFWAFNNRDHFISPRGIGRCKSTGVKGAEPRFFGLNSFAL